MQIDYKTLEKQINQMLKNIDFPKFFKKHGEDIAEKIEKLRIARIQTEQEMYENPRVLMGDYNPT